MRPDDPTGPDPGDHEAPDALRPAPGEWHRRTTLRDGTPVLLRQLRPTDRDRLAEGLRRLTPASRYLRFHRRVDELTDEQLEQLTNIDHVDHEAIVAADLTRPDVPGVGVARYIREPYDPTVAEAAITIADEYQGQGAGTLLLGALAARARDNGVELFRSYVLDGNRAMLDVFDHLGAKRERETDRLWRVDLPVPGDDEEVPSSPAGQAFLEVAGGGRRLASLLPPIWSRWQERGAADAELEQRIADELDELREELDDWLQRPDRR